MYLDRVLHLQESSFTYLAFDSSSNCVKQTWQVLSFQMCRKGKSNMEMPSELSKDTLVRRISFFTVFLHCPTVLWLCSAMNYLGKIKPFSVCGAKSKADLVKM